MPRRFPNGLPACIPSALTRLERRLPAPGDITVRVGSRVEPDDLIGRCSVQPDLILLDVGAELGVEPDDIRRYIRRSVGSRVAFRDVVARRGQRTVVAPMAGVISDIDFATGFMVLTPDLVPASVAAMLRGYVIDVEEGRSATLETPAMTIQGVLGFGDEQWGTLRILVERPDLPIVPSLIDDRCAFALLVGGSITLEALRAARKEQAKAIIVGSVDVDVLRAFWGEQWTTNWHRLQGHEGDTSVVDDGPAIVVTEGFGRLGMNDHLFASLAVRDGQEAYVDPATSLRAPHRRPRVVVPLPYNEQTMEEATPKQDLQPGVTVRLLNESLLGATAQVNAVLPHGRARSGARTATATVALKHGEQVTVPVSVLDILG